MEDYLRVRRMYNKEKLSKREIERRTGYHWKTINKILKYSAPPGYRRKKPIKRPKLGPFLSIIDNILEDDRQQHKKQRHTALRIFDRLREEYGYTGGYTVVKDYVRDRKKHLKEVYIPLRHDPGEAQFDFGEAKVWLNNQLTTLKIFYLDMGYSDVGFMMAFETERTESFLEGHNEAFRFLGGVPKRISYDNLKVAVKRIIGKERELTDSFQHLVSHYLFDYRFCNVARGNEKGKVENLVGYGRRNFLVPIPRVSSVAELNKRLLEQCRKRLEKRMRGHEATIGERFEEEKKYLRPLPPQMLEACIRQSGQVNKLLLVRFDRNDYSAPSEYAHRDVQIKAFVDRIEICHKNEVIATHKRSYGNAQSIYNPVHYLAVLEKKPGAFDQAKPLSEWHLPECFGEYRRQLESRNGSRGKREYIQILRLLEVTSLKRLRQAIEATLHLGVYSFPAVKITLQRLKENSQMIQPLKRELYEHIPFPHVSAANLNQYQQLLHSEGESS